MPLHAGQTSLPIPGGRVSARQRGEVTVLTITQAGRAMRTSLPKDDGIFAGSLLSAHLIAARRGSFLIVSMDYYSRPNGGKYQCGGGLETMLRVITLRNAVHQTFHQLTESCWADIYDSVVTWDEKTDMLVVERTTSDPAAQDLRTRYRVAADGTLTQTQVEHLP